MLNILHSRRTARWPLGAMVAIVCLATTTLADDKAADPKADEAAVRATADAFTKAFNAGDAKAVAALWTEHGSLADDRGRLLKGRQAIEAEYAAFFKANPGAKMTVSIQSIEFPSPNMAIEDGSSQLFAQNAPPTTSRYTVVHVREGDQWKMATVRESGLTIPGSASQLEQLGWLVGRWQTKRDGLTVTTDFQWVANKNFLKRDYSVSKDGVVLSNGVQVIGWDPRARQFRSWSFDASGGFGSGLWFPAPDGWAIETSGVLPDGTPTSSVDRLIRVPGENNVLGWRSTQRRVGDTPLADTREVVLDRVPEKQ